MNFSDETVENVGIAIVERLQLISRDVPQEDLCDPLAKAALSSLTLADLMQVDEVRELVEAARMVEKNRGYVDEDDHDCLKEALTPFTEAK